MARGIAAAIFLASLVLSMTVLSTLGFYSQMGTEIDVDGQNEDVKDAAAALYDVDYGEDRDPSILEGPLASVVPGTDMLITLRTIVGNTSGVVQLLFGAPEVVGDTVQIMFQLALFITIAGFIRGAVL